MNATAIRQELSPSDIEELVTLAKKGESLCPQLTKMVGGIADRYGNDWQQVIEVAPHASKIAEALITSASHHKQTGEFLHEEGFLHVSDAMSAPALSAAEALVDLDASGTFLDPYLAGSMVQYTTAPASHHLADGEIVSKALAIALAESLEHDEVGSRDGLLRLRPLMADVSHVVEDEWYGHLDEHLVSIAKRARLIGHSAAASRARACTEGACRSGKAFQGQLAPELVFALGVTALDAVAGVVSSSEHIPQESLFGRVAMSATFGFPVGWKSDQEGNGATLESESPLQDFDRYDSSHELQFVAHGVIPLRFTWGELEPLVLLTVDAACDKLEKMARSPRLPEWRARRYSLLATAVRGASREKSEYTSFGRAIGIREVAPVEGNLLDGIRLHSAAPVGCRPASLTVKGRGNRPMVLYAVANDTGHLVGYAGLDVLSEEFHGFPERYVYDLDGWRQGRMVDGIYRKGRPLVKMMTAPEGVELPTIKKWSHKA